MKSLVAKALRPILQIYANFLVSQLETDNLDLYEHYMSQAVLLDFCAVEYLDIYLD